MACSLESLDKPEQITAPGMGLSVGAPRGAGGRLWVVRRSVVADGPLEADALLALEQALRVDLGLDRLELREAVRAPDVLLRCSASNL